jgi:hypothetical protein
MPKALLLAESEILGPAALAAYVGPVRAASLAAGGRPVISSIGGRLIPLVGEPLRWSFQNGRVWPRSRPGLASPELKAAE